MLLATLNVFIINVIIKNSEKLKLVFIDFSSNEWMKVFTALNIY